MVGPLLCVNFLLVPIQQETLSQLRLQTYLPTEKLQEKPNVVEIWPNQWRLKGNCSKSRIPEVAGKIQAITINL